MNRMLSTKHQPYIILFVNAYISLGDIWWWKAILCYLKGGDWGVQLKNQYIKVRSKCKTYIKHYGIKSRE